MMGADIIRPLTNTERRILLFLIAADILLAIADISSMMMLAIIAGTWFQRSAATHSLSHFILDHSLVTIGALIFVFMLKNMFAAWLHKKQYRFSYGTAARISVEKLAHYLNGSFISFRDKHSSGNNREIAQMPIEYAQYVIQNIFLIISQSSLIIIASFALALIDVKLLLFITALVIIPLVITSYFLKRRLSAIRVQAKHAAIAGMRHLQEALQGFVELNIYRAQEVFVTRYANAQEKQNRILADQQSANQLPGRIFEMALVGCVCLMVYLVSSFPGEFDTLTLAACMAGGFRILPGISKIVHAWQQVKAYAYSVSGLPATKWERPSAKKEQIKEITFEHISFDYHKSPVVEDLSFTTFAGTPFYLRGFSGKGKTTIALLALGFLEEESGRIRINGIQCAASERRLFAEQVAYIPQQPFIVHDSIAFNISLGRDEQDTWKLNKCIDAAGLRPLIDKYPAGKDHVLLEAGRNISGGERQRIMLARALYKDASWFLFDEPFRELDHYSAQELYELMDNIARSGKMVWIIAHDLPVEMEHSPARKVV